MMFGDEPLLYFQKVYVYITNTDKPWNKLTNEDMSKKKFSYVCHKWYFIVKKKLSKRDIDKHFRTCNDGHNVSEFYDMAKKRDIGYSVFYDFYEPVPLSEYDLKLLLNTIGIKILHFVN